MQKTPTKTHRAVVFIGLAAALVLCAYSGIVHKRVRPPRAQTPFPGKFVPFQNRGGLGDQSMPSLALIKPFDFI